MDTLPSSIIDCLCGLNGPRPNRPQSSHTYALISEKPPLEPRPSADTITDKDDDDEELNNLTAEILKVLLHSPTPAPGTDLTPQITSTTGLRPTSWTSYLAERVLHALEDTLKAADHTTWGEAITDAYTQAKELAQEELRTLVEYEEHPFEVAAEVLLTVLALGVLARLVPAFVRALGFGRLGPVEGT
jgi:hypothetical protein